MGTFDFRVDRTKNRLYLAFNGIFTVEEIEEAIVEGLDAVEQLEDGFDVVNDIRDFKPSSPEAGEGIKRAAKLLVEKGMDRLVRVVGKSVIAKMQFDRVTKSAGYTPDIAASVAAADRILDEDGT